MKKNEHGKSFVSHVMMLLMVISLTAGLCGCGVQSESHPSEYTEEESAATGADVVENEKEEQEDNEEIKEELNEEKEEPETSEREEISVSGSSSYSIYYEGKYFISTEEAWIAVPESVKDTKSLSYTAQWEETYNSSEEMYYVNTYTLKLSVYTENEADVGETVRIRLPMPDMLKESQDSGNEAEYFETNIVLSYVDQPRYTLFEGEFARKDPVEGVEMFARDDEGAIVATYWEERAKEHAYYVWKWEPKILEQYRSYYQENHDIIGWLSIEDSTINSPVMQTLEDEQYYLHRDYYGNESEEGTLFVSANSDYGIGYADDGYEDGVTPSTNILIYGHNMQNGSMFGTLLQYADESYGSAHSIITFNTLYETRTYQVMAAFYSAYYDESYGDDIFRYLNFFDAFSEEEFTYWYDNVMDLALYDTGVSASYGDEFITLSTCSSHTEDGRFAVVAKRIG